MAADRSMVETGKEASNGRGVPVPNGIAAVSAAAAWDREANIFIRLLRAAADVPQLEKDGKIDMKGGGYEYISHDNVSMHAKKVLVKHGVYFMPEVTEIKQEGNRTEIRIHGHFINVDEPNERITYPGVGYGIDGSDKGPGKALSYACKMVLAKALQMNTAEDIEATDTKFEPDATSDVKREAKLDKVSMFRAWAATYKAALSNATTVDELVKLQRDNREQLMDDEVPEVTRDYFIELFQERKKLLGGVHA